MSAMTPAQWRDKLLRDLSARLPEIGLLERYYDGDHPLPAAPDVTSEEYRRLAQLSQANMCGLVVDAVSERLAVRGVRLRPVDGASGDQPVDDLDVWVDVWQANSLDAESVMVHDQALKVGRAFMLVWPTGDGGVSVTPEDPTEVIVAYAPGSRRERVAALKVFRDDSEGERYATLWLPDSLHRWQQKIVDPALANVSSTTGTWEPWDGDDGLGPEAANPMGVVPVVEFRCRPNLRGRVTPEISLGVRRIQDRINKTLFDESVLSEFMAFPQRYAVGITIEEDEHGNPVNPLKSGPQRVWALESEDPAAAKIGQLDAAELGGHLKRVEAAIRQLASITKTPVYYLLGEMVNISADAIRAAEAGLVKKVRGHQQVFGEAHEEVVRLALRALNDPRAGDVALEVDWENAEARSLAELVDAATKKQAIGVPWRQNMEDLGYSPQAIAVMDAERAADALLAAPVVAASGAQ